MRARWNLVALLGVTVVLAAVVLSRGGERATLQRGFADAGQATPRDDLLQRARTELAQGGLSEATRQALLDSDEPEHARARRVLLAMDDSSPPDPAPAETPTETPTATSDLVVPTLATTAKTPPAPKPGPQSSGAPAPTAPATEPRSRPTLNKVALAGSKRGATLTLDAGSGVVVGVANQKSSGIVRLMVEARAEHRVLSSRPKVGGARVTSVRRVGSTVFITLSLDPGWSLGPIRKTGRGARVELRGPG